MTVIKKIISFFRTMTFGMILLVLVIACSFIGSLIPQNEAVMTYVRAYGIGTAAILVQLGFTDIFHTWYFYSLEVLLCLNLLLCSILRFPKTRTAGKRMQEQVKAAQTDHPLTPEQTERIRTFLRIRHYKEATTDSGTLYVKNLSGFYGSFLTHLSILVILLFGSLVLMTPVVTDQTILPGQTLTLEDGTQMTCVSFHIEDETGKLDYASVLTMTSADGSQTKTQEIRVNEPMRFGEYKLYQQTYGTAGQVRIVNAENGAEDILPLEEACFLSIDGKNGIYFNALYPAFVQDEDGNVTLITSSQGSYPNPVYSIQVISDNMSTSVLAFPDETISIGNITFTFLAPMEYPGIRIKHVSSILYGCLYFGFGLMVAALYLCFFTVPVCIRLEKNGYVLLSSKDASNLHHELALIAGKPMVEGVLSSDVAQGKG